MRRTRIGSPHQVHFFKPVCTLFYFHEDPQIVEMLEGHERKEIGLGNTYQMYVYYNHHHRRQLKCVEVAGWHAYLVYGFISN
jgi:hypothetical protein